MKSKTKNAKLKLIKSKTIKTKLTKTKLTKTKLTKTKLTKTKLNKTKLNKTKLIKSKTINTKKQKKSKNINTIIESNINEVELQLLINFITNEIIFLLKNKHSKNKIKQKIIKLLKSIRNNNKIIKINTTNPELTTIFNNIYNHSFLLYEIQTKTQKNKKNNVTIQIQDIYSSNTKGGYYFKDLEDKGDEPITGNDIIKLLDEMQQFFYNAQYTDEGEFTRDPNTLISMFRGDTDAFKGYIIYRILPRYIKMFPPFIKWDAIAEFFRRKRYEDLPDYLLAYQSFKRSQDEYLVEKGLKSKNILNKDLYTGFYNKMANTLDEKIQKFQQYRATLQGRAPLQMPL
jgi:hypothetical protein